MLTGSTDAAEDLAQTTVLRALERLGQWEAGTRLDSWMYKIARNAHIDSVRSARVRGVAVEIDEVSDVLGDDGRLITEGRSELAAAGAALQRLPEEQRALLTLVVLDGKSYKEAADIMDIPIGTVMSRIARARAAIAAQVAGGVVA
jgi:RNA polymerase sigma-70 factor (ECF subfamily)